MTRKATYIKIAEVKVLLTDQVNPVKSFDAAHYVSAEHLYLDALEAWEASFIAVGNPDKNLALWTLKLGLDDGIYPAPEGMVFDVEKSCSCSIPEICGGFGCTSKAIVSFVSPQEDLLNKLEQKNEQLEKAYKSHIVNNTEQLAVKAQEESNLSQFLKTQSKEDLEKWIEMDKKRMAQEIEGGVKCKPQCEHCRGLL